MKVCTDSCIFGAWIEEPEAKRILDIGAGTGLLSLMIAQRHEAKIDAVEIDEDAYLQATENVKNSPWKDKISVFHGDIRILNSTNQFLYDVIICNPPFFKNHLKSPDIRKNHVLHDQSFSLEDLTMAVKRFLSPDGIFYAMLPPWQSAQLEGHMEKKKLWPKKKLIIKEKADKDTIRIITSFSNEKLNHEESILVIRKENNTYSNDFINLLQAYYLHL